MALEVERNALLDKVTEFVRESAQIATSMRAHHTVKGDGSDVTNVDETFDAMFHQRFRGKATLVTEESEPRKGGHDKLLVLDPIDGTTEFKLGGFEWTVGASYYESSSPIYSAVASWGLLPCYRTPEGSIVGESDPRNVSGFLFESREGRMRISPLNRVGARLDADLEVPILERGSITSRSTLIVNAETGLQGGFGLQDRMRTITVNSTLMGQMMVILGMADAYLFNSSSALREKLGPNYPQVKLWDIIEPAVLNAGLVFVVASGPDIGAILTPGEVLEQCDERYYLPEQLLVCELDHVDAVLLRISVMKAQLRDYDK